MKVNRRELIVGGATVSAAFALPVSKTFGREVSTRVVIGVLNEGWSPRWRHDMLPYDDMQKEYGESWRKPMDGPIHVRPQEFIISGETPRHVWDHLWEFFHMYDGRYSDQRHPTALYLTHRGLAPNGPPTTGIFYWANTNEFIMPVSLVRMRKGATFSAIYDPYGVNVNPSYMRRTPTGLYI